jgi:ABC-type molybdate transport system substrate-binding protein
MRIATRTIVAALCVAAWGPLCAFSIAMPAGSANAAEIKGIDFVGPLPADIQEMTVFSAGLHTTASAPEAAKALVKFLTAPEAAAAIKKAGMQPG